MMKIKLVLTDIDGVWTDGGMFYDSAGNEWKKFNTSDSAGVLFLHDINVPVGIITGENSYAVKYRAKKLGVDYLFLGEKNKLERARAICRELNLSLESEVAYIGDDINDVQLLQNVCVSAAPMNAPEYVKEIVDWRLTLKGGEGVFREFVEKLLEENNLLNRVISKYFQI